MAVRRRARASEAAPSEQMLPEAEMEVLAVLHARGEAGAAEIREVLEPYRPMSHASVLTLLGRLETKGLVTRRKSGEGKAFAYTASRSAGPIHRKLLRRLLRRIFADDSVTLVASLFDAKRPTERELSEIRRLLDDLEKRRTP